MMNNTIKYFLVACMAIMSCSGPTSSEKTVNDQKADSVIEDVSKNKIVESEATKEIIIIPKGRCDTNIIVFTESEMGKLTDSDIYDFLFTFSDDCKNDVEFGEYSNEVLFSLLTNYPEELVNNLSKDSIYQNVILEELANPVIELESVDEIINTINSLALPDSIKYNVINGIKSSV